jgi:hypothetical protein
MDSPVVLRFTLVWVDNSHGQLAQLRTFLQSSGIALGRVLKHGNGAYMLQIASPKSVLAAARLMLRFCFKKNRELQAVIDYYKNRITGTELLSIFNEMVRHRVRLGKIRPLVPLPKYQDGLREVHPARGLRAAEARRARKNIKS